MRVTLLLLLSLAGARQIHGSLSEDTSSPEEDVDVGAPLKALTTILLASSPSAAWQVPHGLSARLPGNTHEIGRRKPLQKRAAYAVASDDQDEVNRRLKLASEFVQNEGFYRPVKAELLADDFVFMGPVVGPLNVRDYLGTVGIFKIYEAFPDVEVIAAPFTQDPVDPDRFWSILRVTGTHTGPLDVGDTVIKATGKKMEVGPQAVSVTFDSNDKVVRFTGGYITDVRDGGTGDAGAMFAVMRSVGVPAPRPGGKTVKFLNWVGAKRKDYPKGRSHRDDLPPKWVQYGRDHGLRTKDAWST